MEKIKKSCNNCTHQEVCKLNVPALEAFYVFTEGKHRADVTEIGTVLRQFIGKVCKHHFLVGAE